ncbi:MAG: hypothetical protein VYE40_19435 [Myxococcota bacterium]|nr:hypothetical protein [Myxococcota bacterium]
MAKQQGAGVDIVQFVASRSHFCSRSSEGRVACWEEGQYTSRAEVFERAEAIGVFGERVCAATAREVECVSLTEEGATTHHLPELSRRFENDIQDVQVGDAHVCALLANGNASCWKEEGASIEVGDGVFPGIAQLAVGEGFVCLLDKNERASCWGDAFKVEHTHSVKYDRVKSLVATGGVLCLEQSSPEDLNTVRCINANLPAEQAREYLDSAQGINHLIAPLLAPNGQDIGSPPAKANFSRETFGFAGGRACVIGADKKVRCTEPSPWKYTSTFTSAPREIPTDPVEEVNEVMLVGQATWFTDKDGQLWFLGGSNLVHDASQRYFSFFHHTPQRAFLHAPKEVSGWTDAVTLERMGQVKREKTEVRLKTSSGWFSAGEELLAPTLFYLDKEGGQRPAEELLLTHPDSEWSCTSSAAPDTAITCAKDPLDAAIVNTFPGTPIKLIPDERREMCVLSDNGNLYCRRLVDSALLEQLHSEEIIDASRTDNIGCWVYRSNKMRCWQKSEAGKKSVTLDGIASLKGRNGVTCAVSEGGELLCLGDNKHGLIAPVTYETRERMFDTFTKVEGLPPVEEVILGSTHACALTKVGPGKKQQLWCWGENLFGQLGAPNNWVRDVHEE